MDVRSWQIDELRPKSSTVLSVEPQQITVKGDYFDEGDVILFARAGCRGYVVNPPMKQSDGTTTLDIATRYVQRITTRTEWEPYAYPKVLEPGYIDDEGEWVDPYVSYGEHVTYPLALPYYTVLNLQPNDTALIVGKVYAENSTLRGSDA